MTDATNRNYEIAGTIMEQLGGSNRLASMLGVKHFVAIENGLSFQFASGPKRVNAVRIVLNANDLYDLAFLRIRGIDVKTMSTAEDVFVDTLAEAFEEHTGLFLSLAPREAEGARGP